MIESSAEFITRDGIEVKLGQRWRDCDKRMAGRIRTVTALQNGRAMMMPGRTWVLVRRMYKHSTGWEFQP